MCINDIAKAQFFIFASLESDTKTLAKYKDGEGDKTHMTEQMKQNLTMHLVNISAYDEGSQIGKGRK